jgi:predicted Fe-Mo cluster-binding NifX family protein
MREIFKNYISLKVIWGEELRIAIVTEDFNGLEDVVSKEFSRCNTVTIVEVDTEKKSYRLVEIFENPAKRFSHGAGPIFVYILLEKNVSVAIGPEVGMGTEEMLRETGIKYFKCEPGTKVKDALEKFLSY